MQQIITIIGSTGVGKTQIATEMARQNKIPVVVIDRIQSYTDLSVLSGRPSFDEVRGTDRYYLGIRTTCMGDWDAREAYLALVSLIDALRDYNTIVFEGGSISLWTEIMTHGLPNIQWTSVYYPSFRDKAQYRQKVTARIHAMINDALLWNEMDALCPCTSSQRFAQSVVGYQPLMDVDRSQRHDDSVVQKMATTHLQYAQQQTEFFTTGLLPWLSQQSREVTYRYV